MSSSVLGNALALAAAMLVGWQLPVLLERAPQYGKIPDTVEAGLSAAEVNAQLHAHTAQFATAEVVQVYPAEGDDPGVWPHVYVAIGFGLANSILIEAEDACVVVDTMESMQTGGAVRAAFDAITHDKPITDIIFTHYHPDHTLGSKAFLPDKSKGQTHQVHVHAHAQTLAELERMLSVASSITQIRGARQFGAELRGSDSFVNSGIGPFLANGPDYDMALVYPDLVFAEAEQDLTLHGIDIQIHHAPGETKDQVFVYLPNERILMPADNIYLSFPNLYAIRGTPTRDARQWVSSLDRMRGLSPPPEHLVPCHTRPVRGAERIYNLLTDYRDGISFVHDQTVRFMNLGLTPDEIVLKLRAIQPEHLRRHPYLQEYYGTLDWSVRGIFHSYLGWFSGDPVDLFPLTLFQRGGLLLDVVQAAQDAAGVRAYAAALAAKHTQHDCQSSLELATWLLRDLEHQGIATGDDWKEVHDIRMTAMKCLAGFTTSANGRNYYLTRVLEEERGYAPVTHHGAREFAVYTVPVEQLFQMMAVRLKVETVGPSRAQTNVFVLHDVSKTFRFELRHGILEMTAEPSADPVHNQQVREWLSTADLVVNMTEHTYRDVVMRDRNVAGMLATGEVQVVHGSILQLAEYAKWFELG